ncbi:hypothetical protein AVEN_184474-1 [Araneus ventricosus]|uniref:Uncharacterized protein n=1 Tax=Araneus ventricosus TaxID=182803 RepID=A0A4Y2BHS2_ARAVE|nr:hypothetical protein AVEN_184474-1 [Araneus ventricosus]
MKDFGEDRPEIPPTGLDIGTSYDTMLNIHSGIRRVTLPDEFPARPTSMLKNELIRMNSKIEKKETYSLVLLCCAYFLYGSSLGLYGPLYPEQVS